MILLESCHFDCFQSRGEATSYSNDNEFLNSINQTNSVTFQNQCIYRYQNAHIFLTHKQLIMENTLELYYWPIRGLAERIRLILEYLGLKYQNKVFTDKDEWFVKTKPTINNPFINLPYLKDGETIVAESQAIIVYAILKANRPELLGRTNEQKVDIAQVRGAFGDFHSSYIKLVYGENFEDNKKTFLENANNHLKKFSTFLGEKEYICGQITYVDFLLAEFLSILILLDGTLLDSYPNLKKLNDRIWNEANIKEYVSSGRFKKTPLNGPFAKWQGE